MSEHTKEPWAIHPLMARIVPEDHISRPIGADDDAKVDAATYAQEICAMHWPDRNRSEEEVLANARRIVACVNACAGIQTEVLETLEDKTLNELFKRQEAEYQEQRDKLLRALKMVDRHSSDVADEPWRIVVKALIAEIEASK